MKIINTLLIVFFTCVLASCNNTEPTYETRPENPSAPTITIEGQEELFKNGTTAMVESDVTFKISVAAEAGLTKLLLNDEPVLNFTYGQLKQTFDYKFKMPDVEETTLIFSVCDELEQKTTLSPIKVKAQGRIASDFLLADMGGEFVETQTEIPLPQHPAASTIQQKINITSGIEDNDFAYLRMYWDSKINDTFSFAQTDPAGGEEKCMKITKQGVALNMQIRFDKTIPSALMDGISTGDRKLVMDIYIDSEEVPTANNNFVVVYANFDKYMNDQKGMLNKIISQWDFTQDNLKRWTEAVFDLTTIGNTGNGNYITTSDVDMLVIKPTMNSQHGPYYIKNVRIVKSDELQ